MTLRFLFGVTSPNTAHAFLDGHLGELSNAGADVHLICGKSDDDQLATFADRNQATVHEVPLSRAPQAMQDVCALWHVARALRRTRPDLVSAGTPKMSLLLLTCSWATRVPRRIYICHGLRHEGMAGRKRQIFVRLERFLCRAATEVTAVSDSVKQGLVAIGVPAERVSVIGFGSPDGVDPEFFEPVPAQVRRELLDSIGIAPGTPVASCIARLTRDKGIDALLAAARALPHVTFLVVGAEEPANEHDRATIGRLQEQSNVRLLGRRSDVRNIYAVSHLFLLPTRREGLPTVILEAGAAGVPTVAMDATGTRDVVVDQVTGRLVSQGSIPEFISAVADVLHSEDRREQLGLEAQRLVRQRFDQRTVRSLWRDFYLDRG